MRWQTHLVKLISAIHRSSPFHLLSSQAQRFVASDTIVSAAATHVFAVCYCAPVPATEVRPQSKQQHVDWMPLHWMGEGQEVFRGGNRKYIAINWVKFNWISSEKRKVKAQHNGKLDLVLSFSAEAWQLPQRWRWQRQSLTSQHCCRCWPPSTGVCVCVCECVKYGIDIRRS